MNPAFRNSLEHLGLTFVFKGEYQNAIKLFSGLRKTHGLEAVGTALTAYAAAKGGKIEKAIRNLNKLVKIARNETDSSYTYYQALIYSGLGETSKVMEYLEKSIEERLGNILYLAVHPEWKQYKNNKRFKQLLNTVGLRLPRRGKQSR